MSTVCGIEYDPVQAGAIIGSFVIGVMFVVGIGWIKAVAHARREARIEKAIADRIAKLGIGEGRHSNEDEPSASAPAPVPVPVVAEAVDARGSAAQHQPKSMEQRVAEARARAKAKEQAQKQAHAGAGQKPWEVNGAAQSEPVSRIIIPGQTVQK